MVRALRRADFPISCLVGAQKWHPDRWASDPAAAGEAKQRFQRIQEAYSGKATYPVAPAPARLQAV
jgi:hypothetical protein